MFFDADVAAGVRKLPDDLLPVAPASVLASPATRVVVLTGGPQAPQNRELIPVALRLVWDADTVVGVGDRLGERTQETRRGEAAQTSAWCRRASSRSAASAASAFPGRQSTDAPALARALRETR